MRVADWKRCFPSSVVQSCAKFKARCVSILELKNRVRSPNNPDAAEAVELARVSAKHARWQEAVDLWEYCFRVFPDQTGINWHIEYGRALMALDRLDEAEAVFGTAASQFSDHPDGLAGHAQISMLREDWSGAINHWTSCLMQYPDVVQPAWLGSLGKALNSLNDPDAAFDVLESLPQRLWMRPGIGVVQSMARFGRIPAARSLFSRLIADMESGSNHLKLIKLIPRLYDGDEKTRQLQLLMTKLEKSRARSAGTNDDGFLLAEAVARLQLRDYHRFKEIATQITGDSKICRELKALCRRLSDPADTNSHKPKVFCIGLSKTGTASLTNALRLLGYRAIHWNDNITGELICDDHFPYFDAFSDTPISFRFEEIYSAYPDAKFIYTTRDISSWCRSIQNHYSANHDVQNLDDMRNFVSDPQNCLRGELFARIHENLYCRFDDYDQAYMSFDQRVRGFFSGDRNAKLLELSITSGDGWSKLCDFLQRPVPDEPFPWSNKTSTWTIDDASF